METARQLIDALQNETREESVSPQRLAGIYDAILDQEESDREILEKKIAEAAASGSTELPEDFLERVDAIGTTASSALDKAGAALDKAGTALDKAEQALRQIGEGQAGSSAESAQALSKANDALEAAGSAQATATNAKTAADNAKNAADNAMKLAAATEESFSTYSEKTDSRLESLEDFRTLVGNVSFWTGTMQEYDSLAAKDPTTIYFITE